MVTRRAGGAASGVQFSPPRHKMKLISLNTWGGKIYQPLIEFIKQQAKDTDIFCLQEVFSTTEDISEDLGFKVNLYQEIVKNLSHHKGYFTSSIDNYLAGSFQKNFTDYNLSSGLTIFIKKELKIINHGDFFLFGNKKSYHLNDFNSMPKNAQYINFNINDKQFIILNIHGIWLREGKNDNPSRLKQSEKIKQFLDNQKGKKILCGDFNLDINTESLKILEENMTNLIKKYNIQTTRNEHFPGAEKFADYIFASNDINIESFTVPDVDISDHLPMILEFS